MKLMFKSFCKSVIYNSCLNSVVIKTFDHEYFILMQ